MRMLTTQFTAFCSRCKADFEAEYQADTFRELNDQGDWFRELFRDEGWSVTLSGLLCPDCSENEKEKQAE